MHPAFAAAGQRALSAGAHAAVGGGVLERLARAVLPPNRWGGGGGVLRRGRAAATRCGKSSTARWSSTRRVVTLAPGDHVLELFHGPTLAFKDFGARFMARLMAWLTRGDGRLLTVLVATSGDTGGAVASAFHGVPGTRVIVLYPYGKVSGLQEKQLTTLGDNITAIEVAGTFDDCQRLVKSAFLDRKLSEDLNLTSANSINLARLVPQAFYYFHAARQLPAGAWPVFVVPSGNFGNLTAGLLAAELGLPVKRFVAATNVNDVVPDYLASGVYQPRPSVATISNAMDVGAPSNFARMQALFGGSLGSDARADQRALRLTTRKPGRRSARCGPPPAM